MAAYLAPPCIQYMRRGQKMHRPKPQAAAKHPLRLAESGKKCPYKNYTTLFGRTQAHARSLFSFLTYSSAKNAVNTYERDGYAAHTGGRLPKTQPSAANGQKAGKSAPAHCGRRARRFGRRRTSALCGRRAQFSFKIKKTSAFPFGPLHYAPLTRATSALTDRWSARARTGCALSSTR